jgi:hypothetical protein
MSIRAETETTEEIRLEPVSTGNSVRLLLSKHDNPVQRVKDLEHLMANIDPNRS